MLNLQSHSTSNTTSISQKAAVEALHGPQDSVRTMLSEYQRRRDKIVAGLRAIPGITCANPAGAFYVYPNVGAYLKKNGTANCQALVDRLLEDAHVAVVPGPGFGTNEHVRLSYATSMENIEEGLQRMKKFFAEM
jgi:aspartate aminotransferase